jgi:hypothetical protein
MDESTKRGLLAAYGRLLKPLVRILIRNGVVYEEFAGIAKETFVRVAAESSSKGNEANRLDLIEKLTGLNTNQVEETLLAIEALNDDPEGLGVQISVILSVWHTNSNFTGPYGLPLELPFDGNKEKSFQTLVASCTTGTDHKRLMDSMIEAGAAVETQPGWLKALTRSYIADNGPDLIEHLSETIEVIANTIEHNESETDPKKKLFERQVVTHEGIREEDLPKFAKFAGEKSQRLLEEIDNWISQQDEPSESERNQLSTGFGIYHFVNKNINGC